VGVLRPVTLPLLLFSVMELMVTKNETTEGRGASSPVMNTAVGLEELPFCPPDPAGPPPHATAITKKLINAAKLRMRFMSTPKYKDFSGGDSFY
jgi:hypothetical protein